MILFKVFIKCGENGVKYYSGKKMIRAASKVHPISEDNLSLCFSKQALEIQGAYIEYT